MNNTALRYLERCHILEGTSDTIVQFPSNIFVINQIIVCCLNCLSTAAAVLLNAVAILTIYKRFHLKEKMCYFLIFLQAVIDLITGGVSIPSFTFVLMSEVAGFANCVVNFVIATLAFLPMGLSLALLCGLSFERYMGVLHPVVHRTQLTRKRLLAYLCFATLAVFTMMLLSLVFTTFYFVFASVNICISLTLITFFYTRIFLAARQRHRSQNRPAQGVVELSSSERTKRKQFIKEFKLAKSCFLLVVTFLLCFTPMLVVSVLSVTVMISPEMAPRFRLLQSWAITLALFNHSLNSVIFFWTRPMLKSEAKKVLKSIWESK
jgi:hypothetical protein